MLDGKHHRFPVWKKLREAVADLTVGGIEEGDRFWRSSSSSHALHTFVDMPIEDRIIWSPPPASKVPFYLTNVLRCTAKDRYFLQLVLLVEGDQLTIRGR